MKKHCKIIYIIETLIILLLLIYIIFRTNIYKNLYDDILFLNSIQKKEIEDEVVDEKSRNIQNQYVFKLDCKNTEFKDVNLLETIDNKTKVNEKIAPGTEGRFQIIIEANQDSNYSIEFQSKNSKPQNLLFENEETKIKRESLEELNSELNGKINKNEKKLITIHWIWQYENTEEKNKQDTIDSENIRNYEFTIYAIGKSIS